MPDYICHGCGRKVSRAYQCSKCGKILCSSCRSYTTCKDNKNGEPGCSGSYKQLP